VPEGVVTTSGGIHALLFGDDYINLLDKSTPHLPPLLSNQTESSASSVIIFTRIIQKESRTFYLYVCVGGDYCDCHLPQVSRLRSVGAGLGDLRYWRTVTCQILRRYPAVLHNHPPLFKKSNIFGSWSNSGRTPGSHNIIVLFVGDRSQLQVSTVPFFLCLLSYLIYHECSTKTSNSKSGGHINFSSYYTTCSKAFIAVG